MKLKTLEIKNFRCFESLSIDLDEQLTVLVAENGVGKTAILDAIAIGLSPFIGGFDTGTGKGFKPEDARLKVADKLLRNVNFLIVKGILHRVSEMEPQYPVSLIASGTINREDQQWSRELTGKKTKTTFGKARVLIDYAKTLQKQVRAGEPVTLPIVAYYGTGRLLKQGNTTRKSSTESRSRLYGYHDALNPNSNYKTFEKWFIEESVAEIKAINSSLMFLDKLDETGYKPPYSIELKYVRKAINQCLSISGWNTLEYDPKLRELIVSNNKNFHFMPVAQLSDGVKSMLSLTSDIAYRCVQLNPHLASPTEETNGIILIDEVDLHLHPKWQQTVLSDLREAFPNIQFIVTTHSPQVISTVPSHQIRILDENQVYLAEAGTQGAEASRILKRIFGVDPRPQHDPNTQLLNEYLDLVYADKWNEAKEKRAKLDAIYQGNEPALTEADLYIENRQWELEVEENQ